MTHGGDPGGVGDDGRTHVVLLVHDEVRAEVGQHRCQVGGRPRRDHVEEQPAADLQIRAPVGSSRHLVQRQRPEQLRVRLLDREPDVVGRVAQAVEPGEEVAGGHEAHVMAGAAGGRGEREQWIHLAICRPGAEDDLHGTSWFGGGTDAPILVASPRRRVENS